MAGVALKTLVIIFNTTSLSLNFVSVAALKMSQGERVSSLVSSAHHILETHHQLFKNIQILPLF